MPRASREAPDVLTADAVRAEALRIGFVACGIATLEPSRRAGALDRWLARGYAGTMGYLPRQARKRKAPATITPGARTAVVVLENYAPGDDERPNPDDAFRVASYARGMDYHIVTHGRLHILSEWLKAQGAEVAHTWVDDSPVPERELAERAGLGWIGKNSMLIHPRIGSFTLIGTIFTDLDLAEPAAPPADLCGTCTRCLEACPTEAFVEPRVLDATRCISYLTIEHRAEPAPELARHFAGWAFGCDICNSVCPWNLKFSAPTTVPEFRDRRDPDRTDADVFERMDEEEFRRRYADTPLARPGLDRMRRNVRLAIASRATGSS
jgi:epoxyqueuosine reductase